ncbi:MAG: DUF3450 family protein [Myxococcota bacterium]
MWQALEDELRLGRENGLYKQVVVLEGRSKRVEVARVGMVMLFVKTSGGQYGAAHCVKGKWHFLLYTEAQRRARRQVAQLFDGFKKQIRTGYWSLPNALPNRFLKGSVK